MCTCPYKMSKWNIYILFIFFTLIHGENVDKKICADSECREPISLARTLLKYSSNDRNIMSFGLNEEVTVYSKYKGSKSNIWTVQIGGKRGDVPKQFVQEYKIVAKSTVELQLETVDEVVNSPSATVDTLQRTSEELNGSTRPLVDKTEIDDSSVPVDEIISTEKKEVNSEELDKTPIATESVLVELSPSPVVEQPLTVDLRPSLLLDNVVEYTEKKDHFSVNPVESGAWFPEVASSSSEINKDGDQKLTVPDGVEDLLPSLTSAESISQSTPAIKYIIVDGTSIYDEGSEPISVAPGVPDEPQVIQPTPILTAPSLDQLFSSSVDYFQSSSVDSMLESTDLPQTSNTVEEIVSRDDSDVKSENNKEESNIKEYNEVEMQSEVVSGGWLNGISEFFSLSDGDASTKDPNSDRSATVEVTSATQAASDTIKNEEDSLNNLNPLPASSEHQVIDAEDKTEDEEDDVADENDPDDEDDTETADKDEEADLENDIEEGNKATVDVDGEKSYASRNLLSANNTVDDESDVVSSEENRLPNELDASVNGNNEEVIGEALTESKDNIADSKIPSESLDLQASPSDLNEEKVASSDNIVSDSAQSENVQTESAQPENVQTESPQPEIVQTESAQSENVHTASVEPEKYPTVETNKNTDNYDAPSENSTSDSEIHEGIQSSQTVTETEIQKEESSNILQDSVQVDVIGHNDDSSLKMDYTHIEDSNFKVTEDVEKSAEVEYLNDKSGNPLPKTDQASSQDTEIEINDKTASPDIHSEHDTDSDSETKKTSDPDSEMSNEKLENILKVNSDSCDKTDDGSCDDVPVLKEKNLPPDAELTDEETVSSDILSQIKGFIDLIQYWGLYLLPEPIVEISHELEARSISPRVVILTVIVGIFVFVLEISFIAIKKRFKERQYLSKLGSLDQKLFSAVVERDDLKQELTALKLRTENSSTEYLDAQGVIEDLQHKWQCSKSSSTKLQEAVTKLQEQLESQQKNMNNLQLKLEQADQESAQHKNEIEDLKAKMTTLEKINEELTININELSMVKDQITEENQTKDQQIIELQQINAQFLQEGEEWNESVQRLQAANDGYQSKIQELNDTLSIKANELMVIKEFLANLKFSKENANESVDNNDNSDSVVLNADKILQQISNVSNIKSELIEVKEERESLKRKLLDENQTRIAAEEIAQSCTAENEKLKDEFSKAHRERLEAQTRLDVLSNYFKEKEMQLQKELGFQEAMRQQSQDSATSITQRIATYEQEAELNRSQIAALKAEIENQERSFRNQLLVHEKKAHENWLAARVAERKLEQTKQDSAVLRNKLTLLEQEKIDNSEINKSASHQANSSTNGEALSTQNALEPDDRSASMDLPTSGRSSLFREPIESEHRFPFLPPDRPLPPPPFIPPMPILPPPHMLPMGGHVPLLPHPPPPHMLGPRRPQLPPLDHWMPDRIRHSSPYDHLSNRERKSPPVLSHQRSPPPYDERPAPLRGPPSQSPHNNDRRGEEMYNRDFYREQTPPSRYPEQTPPSRYPEQAPPSRYPEQAPPSRYPEQPSPHNNYMADNLPPHLRRHKLDNGALDQRKPSPVINRSDNSLSSV